MEDFNTIFGTWKLEEFVKDMKCVECAKLPLEKPKYYLFVFKNLDKFYNIKIEIEEEKNLHAALKLADSRAKQKVLNEKTKLYEERVANIGSSASRQYLSPDGIYLDASSGSFTISPDANISFGSGTLPITSYGYTTSASYEYCFSDGKDSLKISKDGVISKNEKEITDPLEIGKCFISIAKNIKKNN